MLWFLLWHQGEDVVVRADDAMLLGAFDLALAAHCTSVRGDDGGRILGNGRARYRDAQCLYVARGRQIALTRRIITGQATKRTQRQRDTLFHIGGADGWAAAACYSATWRVLFLIHSVRRAEVSEPKQNAACPKHSVGGAEHQHEASYRLCVESNDVLSSRLGGEMRDLSTLSPLI